MQTLASILHGTRSAIWPGGAATRVWTPMDSH